MLTSIFCNALPLILNPIVFGPDEILALCKAHVDVWHENPRCVFLLNPEPGLLTALSHPSPQQLPTLSDAPSWPPKNVTCRAVFPHLPRLLHNHWTTESLTALPRFSERHCGPQQPAERLSGDGEGPSLSAGKGEPPTLLGRGGGQLCSQYGEQYGGPFTNVNLSYPMTQQAHSWTSIQKK